MQNAVPKAFRTPFLKSSKTKTKPKYLWLTLSAYLSLCFWLAFREVGKEFPTKHHLSDARPERSLAERNFH